jgi:hypothetical protein
MLEAARRRQVEGAPRKAVPHVFRFCPFSILFPILRSFVYLFAI